MADCNRLKHINDTFGHSRGDDFLISTVDNIRQILDGQGEIIRLGGDEFLILIPECDEKQCLKHIQRLQESERTVYVHNIPLSTAYGYSIMNSSADTLETAVHLADQCMYRAKASFRENS